MRPTDWIKEIISKGQPVLIATHEGPDGDCIGSALALALTLKAKGVEVGIVNKDPIPENFRFLAGSQEILLPASLSPKYELVILVDCTDLDRLGFDLSQYCPNINMIINIDHHVSNTNFGDRNLVEPDVSATGEIIFNLLQDLSFKLNPDQATALYTAIVTDSGSFQYENTSPRTLRIAAKLLEAGVDTGKVRKHLWESKPLVTIRALQIALNSLTIKANGSLAWVSLDNDSINALGATNEHLEGLVNYPRSIVGVEIAMVFKETHPNIIKVSLRSKDYIDVNLLAQKFNGGGHQRAAGCTIKAPLRQAINEVVVAAEEMLLNCKGGL